MKRSGHTSQLYNLFMTSAPGVTYFRLLNVGRKRVFSVDSSFPGQVKLDLRQERSLDVRHGRRFSRVDVERGNEASLQVNDKRFFQK